jgi:hypothetical protein
MPLPPRPKKLILKDPYVEVDEVHFSDHTSSVEVALTKDEVDTTSFDGKGRERHHGLKDDSFTFNFQQNFSAGSVDATLFPLYDEEDEFEVVVRPKGGDVSAENPGYYGVCILLSYTPLSGSPGDLSESSVTIPTQRRGIARFVSEAELDDLRDATLAERGAVEPPEPE